MKKVPNATASETLMVCLDPRVRGEIAEQRLQEETCNKVAAFTCLRKHLKNAH